MTLDEIQAEWEKDSEIDRTELGQESIKIPQLHSKYYKMFSKERLILRKLEADYKILKFAKHEFYTQGPNEETQAKGWKFPNIGQILKSDLNTYMEADKDIIEISLRIGYQQEKVDMLESAIKSLVARGFNLKAAIEWEKFKVGA
jgi:hypothetical protein